jgi:hypothetical protein
MARLRELGWHARLHVNGDDLLAFPTHGSDHAMCEYF